MTSVPDSRAPECAAFGDLLVESGLVSASELTVALAAGRESGASLDSVLVDAGIIAPAALRAVLSRAWSLPAVDLARTHVDFDLVNQWPDDLYLLENWFPVRDQANGTVLVATSRQPDDSRSAHITEIVGAPVEFAAVGSADIAKAVVRAARRRARPRRLFLS